MQRFPAFSSTYTPLGRTVLVLNTFKGLIEDLETVVTPSSVRLSGLRYHPACAEKPTCSITPHRQHRGILNIETHYGTVAQNVFVDVDQEKLSQIEEIIKKYSR